MSWPRGSFFHLFGAIRSEEAVVDVVKVLEGHPLGRALQHVAQRLEQELKAKRKFFLFEDPLNKFTDFELEWTSFFKRENELKALVSTSWCLREAVVGPAKCQSSM